MDILSNFSENLSDMIFDRNLTPKTFSEQAKIDRSVLYKYLRKEILPTLTNLIKISDFFQCSADYLLGTVPVESKATYKPAPPFSLRFQALLQKANLTRYRFLIEARKKEIHFAKQSVDDWYHGKRTPTVENIVLLAKFFNCTVDNLLGRES